MKYNQCNVNSLGRTLLSETSSTNSYFCILDANGHCYNKTLFLPKIFENTFSNHWRSDSENEVFTLAFVNQDSLLS